MAIVRLFGSIGLYASGYESEMGSLATMIELYSMSCPL